MSLYLNDNEKLLVPTQENLLDYCLMRSPNGRNRFILYLKHDIQLIQGERVCVRCWKHMKDVEAALETREKKVSG